MAIDYTEFLQDIRKPFGCDCCGGVWRGTNRVYICPDCGQYFCVLCVGKGMVPKHVCGDLQADD